MSTDFQIAEGFTRLGTEPFFMGLPKANRYLTTTKSQTSPNWGVYNFEINTNVYDKGSSKNHSLRIISTVPDGRIGVLWRSR